MDTANARGRFEKPQIGTCIQRLTGLMGDRAKKCAVIKLYLNNFKSYNDSFGYAFGGTLINQITAYLEGIEGIEAYHIRGVEYILVAENASRQTVDAIMLDIMDRFETAWEIDDFTCLCSVNAGVLYLPGHAGSPNEVLEQLGHAISEATLMGHNQVVEYNQELIETFQRRSAIAQQIPQAVKTGGFEVRYRPAFQTSTGRYTRIDCGMSMFCEGLGLIKEEELIQVAEQSGQINAVSRFIISKACAMVKELLAQKKDFETVAVEVSPMQLMQERFVSDVADMIALAGIPAERLAFEVNESMANSVFSRAHTCMNELSDMGIEMVLADFGMGSLGIYSFMSMAINAVKIMRPLLWQMENTPDGAGMVSGLISFAKNFGLKLVAEGVETKAQVQMLEEFGCDYQQGLYYAASLTADELMAKMTTR